MHACKCPYIVLRGRNLSMSMIGSGGKVFTVIGVRLCACGIYVFIC